MTPHPLRLQRNRSSRRSPASSSAASQARSVIDGHPQVFPRPFPCRADDVRVKCSRQRPSEAATSRNSAWTSRNRRRWLSSIPAMRPSTIRIALTNGLPSSSGKCLSSRRRRRSRFSRADCTIPPRFLKCHVAGFDTAQQAAAVRGAYGGAATVRLAATVLEPEAGQRQLVTAFPASIRRDAYAGRPEHFHGLRGAHRTMREDRSVAAQAAAQAKVLAIGRHGPHSDAIRSASAGGRTIGVLLLQRTDD